MKSFKQYVIEKRRNPDQNIKVSVLDKLLQYAGRGTDTYVSFRDLNKLGINPQSKYSTPNGIYCYRLQDFESSLESEHTIKQVFPFTGDKPAEYAYVFEPKPEANVVYLSDVMAKDVIDYMEVWFDKYPKTKNFFEHGAELEVVQGELQELEQRRDAVYEFIGIKNWEQFVDIYMNTEVEYRNSYKTIAEHMVLSDLILGSLYTLVDVDLGDDSFINSKQVFTKPNLSFMSISPDAMENMSEAIDFNDVIEAVEAMIENVEVRIYGLEEDIQELQNFENAKSSEDFAEWLYYNHVDLYIEPPKENSPDHILWWFGWTIFKDQPNKWNKFFRVIGIDGVVDDDCQGIIHPSEECQAVFFDKTKINVLESIVNKEYVLDLDNIKVKSKHGVESIVKAIKNSFGSAEAIDMINEINDIRTEYPRNEQMVKDFITNNVIPKLEEVEKTEFKLLR